MMGARRRVFDFFFLLAHVAFRHGVFGLGIASALEIWVHGAIWVLVSGRETGKGICGIGFGFACVTRWMAIMSRINAGIGECIWG
jgi:hypothetical protein